MKRGVLRTFDALTHTATVEIAGSPARYLSVLAVSRGIDAAEMIPGRRVAVHFFDPANPGDAIVIAIWT